MSSLLVVEHDADDPPARFGGWLEEAGCRLDVCRPWAGDRLPEQATGYAGLLVMGGWMSAHHDQEIAWLAGAKDLVRGAARDGVPTLGICLGHQVIAVALGGRVARNPRGQQVGLVDVGWLPAAGQDRLTGPVVASSAAPRRGLHWNDDVVTAMPAGSVELARAPTGENQAARFAPGVWGVQWHPEVDEPLVRRWAGDDLASGRRPDQETALAELAGADDELERAWRPMAQRFAEIAGARR